MQFRLQAFSTAICLLGIVVGIICKKMAPEYWFDLYSYLIVFYWAMEMIVSFIIGHYEADINEPTLRGKRFMHIMTGVKIAKATLTIVCVFLGYYHVDEAHQAVFAGSAIALYLMNLGAEQHVINKSKKQSK